MKKYLIIFLILPFFTDCSTSNPDSKNKDINVEVKNSIDTITNLENVDVKRNSQNFFNTYICYTNEVENQGGYVLNPYIYTHNDKSETIKFDNNSFHVETFNSIYIPIVSISSADDTVFKDNQSGKKIISINHKNRQVREDYFIYIDSLYFLSKVRVSDYENFKNGEELFFDFFNKFITDNLFKTGRIVWPLKVEKASFSDGKCTLKDTVYWSYPPSDNNDYYFNNIFLNNDINQIETTDTVFFYFVGHQYGYIFIKKKGEYFLDKLLSHQP